MAAHESPDVKDIAQLAEFIRSCNSNCVMSEELLELIRVQWHSYWRRHIV
jgi:hypothetical protein